MHRHMGTVCACVCVSVCRAPCDRNAIYDHDNLYAIITDWKQNCGMEADHNVHTTIESQRIHHTQTTKKKISVRRQRKTIESIAVLWLSSKCISKYIRINAVMQPVPVQQLKNKHSIILVCHLWFGLCLLLTRSLARSFAHLVTLSTPFFISLRYSQWLSVSQSVSENMHISICAY